MKRQLVVAATLLLTPLAAFADGFIAGLGYANRDDINGVEVELGYRKTFSNVGVNVSPLSGIFHSKDDPRYRKETFSNGQTVCRDTTNGQFADKENCDGTAFSYGFITSIDYSWNDRFALGAGVRLGEGTTPFLAARIQFGNKWGLQLRAGAQYASGALTWGF